MSDSQEPITAYDKSAFIKKFSQDLPGSDKHMEPTAEHTKVERWDENGEPYLVSSGHAQSTGPLTVIPSIRKNTRELAS